MTFQDDPGRSSAGRNDPVRQDYVRSDRGPRGLVPVLLGLVFLFVVVYMFLTAPQGPGPTTTTGIEHPATPPKTTTPQQ